MTENLTIKDLNCGNCTTICCGFHPDCVAYREPIFEERVEAVRWFVSVWGCARHPLALQVLAAPVIEELETEEKDRIYTYEHSTTMNEETYSQGIIWGIQKAIKLLKEGVNKP